MNEREEIKDAALIHLEEGRTVAYMRHKAAQYRRVECSSLARNADLVADEMEQMLRDFY